MQMPNIDHSLSAYDYELPSHCIAQNPAVPRHNSRLLAVDTDKNIHHFHFYQLPQLLKSGDLLIFNNTRVIPARMHGHKISGVPVEILLMEPTGHNRWLSLVKPGKRLPVGSTIIFNEEVKATVEGIDEATRARDLLFHIPEDQTLHQIIDHLGKIPFPPYVTESQADSEQYQTVYAKVPGAIAAPTAGLHFTEPLLQQLSDMGVNQAYITLHVGLGTFRPVETEDVREHKMHSEWFEVSQETIALIEATKAKGGRVIGVGTTVVRAIESSNMQPYQGKTNLMLYPGYEWKILDGLITNFHLPKSSLMMLVASLLGEGGREFLLSLYQEAIAQNYRFYSFGDAMMLWRRR
ncbi:tRNA preQ1(34) S-adenosylmethionine ribosyltransferase-isomerase QueA [Tumidithrix helvetica PCC 7403]